MKTQIYLPVSVAVLSFILVGCSAATTPILTQTPIPPIPIPSDTMPPFSLTPPAATNTPAPGGTGTVDIAIKGFAFDPVSITIKVGTTVRWTNQDSANHTITSDSGVWDSGSIAQSESYTRVFDTVGTFAYHCAVHPSMKGTIIVTS
jgi:plastocyanin